MPRKRLRLLLAAIALGSTLVTPGCSGSKEDVNEGAEAPAASAAQQGQDGEPRINAAEPLDNPDGFPESVPVYPGSVASYESTEPNDIMTVHVLQVTTDTSYGEVVEWYQAHLPDGWALEEFQEKEIGGVASTAMFWLVGPDFSRDGSNVLVTVHEEKQTRVQTSVTVLK